MRLFELENSDSDFAKVMFGSAIEFSVKTIRENCQQFLAESKFYFHNKNHVLYRGTNDHNTNYFLGSSKNDRKPRDTNINIQNAIDYKLEEAGFIARRGNSTFCWGREHSARDYGNIYAIFPFDGYSYTWSTGYHDFTGDFNPRLYLNIPVDLYLASLNNNTLFNQLSNKIMSDPINMFLEETGYMNNDLIEAIDSGNEIMINGKYIAVKNSILPYVTKEIKVFN